MEWVIKKNNPYLQMNNKVYKLAKRFKSKYFGTIASGTNESNNGNDNIKNKKNSNTIKI